MNHALDRMFSDPLIATEIPFRHKLTKYGALDERHRARNVIHFVDREDLGDILDVGTPNFVKGELAQAFCKSIDSTQETDFNFSVAAPRVVYDTIFCLEVLEHIMNPLSFLLSLRKLLKPGGTLYLSTPMANALAIHCSLEHLTEYKEEPLRRMIEHAGFRVEKRVIFGQHPWWFTLTGVRPMVRALFFRTQLYELQTTTNP